MAEEQNFQKAAKDRLDAQAQFKKMVGGFVLLWAVMIAIWALSGAGYFWPAWVILGTVLASIAVGWRAYGPRDTGPKQPTQAEIDAEAKKFEDSSKG